MGSISGLPCLIHNYLWFALSHSQLTCEHASAVPFRTLTVASKPAWARTCRATAAFAGLYSRLYRHEPGASCDAMRVAEYPQYVPIYKGVEERRIHVQKGIQHVQRMVLTHPTVWPKTQYSCLILHGETASAPDRKGVTLNVVSRQAVHSCTSNHHLSRCHNQNLYSMSRLAQAQEASTAAGQAGSVHICSETFASA